MTTTKKISVLFVLVFPLIALADNEIVEKRRLADLTLDNLNLDVLEENESNLQTARELFQTTQELRNKGSNIDLLLPDFYKAANMGYPPAQSELARLFLEGEYVIKHPIKGIEYLEKALESNDAHAQFLAGELYSRGEHYPLDLAKAKHYFEQSALNGYAESFLKLAKLERNRLSKNSEDASQEKMLRYYAIAANYGVIKAIDELGILYFEGTEVNQDFDKAIDYFYYGAVLDSPQSTYYLGMMHLDGINTEKNEELAYEILQYSCELEYELACDFFE